MKSFIDVNPGLKSRFTRYIEFEDYNPCELVDIFRKLATDKDYKLEDETSATLLLHMTAAYENRGRDFGNGRYARTIFEEAVEKHAARVMRAGSMDLNSLATLTAEDLPL